MISTVNDNDLPPGLLPMGHAVGDVSMHDYDYDEQEDGDASSCYSSDYDSSDYDSDDSSVSSDYDDEEEELMKEIAQELNLKKNMSAILSIGGGPTTTSSSRPLSRAPAPVRMNQSMMQHLSGRVQQMKQTSAVYIQREPMTNSKSSKSETTSTSTGTKKTNPSPQETLNDILQDLSFPQQATALKEEGYWKQYFLPVTAERQSFYSLSLTKAVRAIDLPALETVAAQNPSSQWMNACNRQGESLMHVACRRSNVALVECLLQYGATLQVQDDYGKTPLHDACWTANPNFAMIALVVREAPALLFCKDSRGFTPLDYVPRSCHAAFNAFLTRKAAALRLSVQYLGFTRASQQLQSTQERLQVLLEEHLRSWSRQDATTASLTEEETNNVQT